MVIVGVHVREDASALRATLASLARVSPGATVVLLPDAPDPALAQVLAALGEYPRCEGDARGAPAAFNRLVAFDSSSIIVLLESGSIVTTGWLDRLRAVLVSNPRVGLAGPSTNLAWNRQRVAGAPDTRAPIDRIEAFARSLAEGRGDRWTPPEPKYSLSDFCYAATREAIEAIGLADEGFGEGPCWEMEYNARAAAAGFEAAWAQGSYVHRLPIGARRTRAEARLFAESRRRYQARLRALEPPSQAPSPPPAEPVVTLPGALPLVSCIMPTRDRRPFVARAVRQFLAQDYGNRELIVVDDGADSIADLLPSDERVRLIRPSRRLTVGAKRNLACDAARGDLILHWDDDDWMADWRVRYQADALLRQGADVCGLASLYFYEPGSGRAWRYVYRDRTRSWLAGGTLCYRKAIWRAHPFAEINEGEDTRFVWGLRGARFLALDDLTFYVATVHGGNTSRKRTDEARYEPCPADAVERIMGQRSQPRVSCIMPTRDRRRFVPLAIEYFLRQDYPNRELIVVDDGCDRIDDLLPADPRVRYVPVAAGTIGAKRNAALREASGEYVAHWDDDDWYAAGRLSAQIAPLAAGEADVVALSMRHVLALPALEFWRCDPALHARLHYRDLCCGTIVYRRALWDRHGPYPAFNVAEDVRFLQRLARAGARVQRLDAESLFICVRHGRNTWRIVRDWTSRAGGWTRAVPPPSFAERDGRAYRELAATLEAVPGKPAA